MVWNKITNSISTGVNLYNSGNKLNIMMPVNFNQFSRRSIWRQIQFQIYQYIFHVLRFQKRKNDFNLNYFIYNSFTGLIVLFILLALDMIMEIYELGFFLIHFQSLKFHILESLLYIQRNNL